MTSVWSHYDVSMTSLWRHYRPLSCQSTSLWRLERHYDVVTTLLYSKFYYRLQGCCHHSTPSTPSQRATSSFCSTPSPDSSHDSSIIFLNLSNSSSFSAMSFWNEARTPHNESDTLVSLLYSDKGKRYVFIAAAWAYLFFLSRESLKFM